MVKIVKELTHIYHGEVHSAAIAIGQDHTASSMREELFAKSLALTSDLKRLPFLLGGKVFIWMDAHALYNLWLSGGVGLGITVVLLNGTYATDDFDDYDELINDERAKDDVLLVAHGTLHVHGTPITSTTAEFVASHWDFEGNLPLFDTISLMVYLDIDTNVEVTDFLSGKLKGQFEIEIDWRPFSKAELQEFIMEHIYAKQGD